MEFFRKKWIITSLLLLVLGAAIFVLAKKYADKSEEKRGGKIGWVTDIHADRFKKRNVDSGLLYPKKYTEYLPKVFDALKSEGIDVVIATGDNTNSGDDNYARDILKIAQEKNMDVIWVRGNHDNDEVMSILGVTGKNYYYRDFKNLRVVALDTTQYTGGEYDYYGGINEEQMAWIRNDALKTDRKIVVAMHMPMFKDDILHERYAELEKMFLENGQVKVVLAGHYHIPWQKEYHGIKYYIEGALTRDGEEGAYATIDMGNDQVDYKFAK